MKAAPFGSHFATKLEGVNNKLVCALSAATTCSDDLRPPSEPVVFEPAPLEPVWVDPTPLI